MNLAATVLIPTHSHEDTLLSSVASAQAQTVQDIEILIVGDGVTNRTREIVSELAKDERIKFFDYQKGPRHGEHYRHEVLKNARGKIVAYLSDDDLWFPKHLESMLQELENADFANALTMCITANGQASAIYCNLASQLYRNASGALARGYVVLSAGSHTLDFYQRLPYGWRTTPRPYHTDGYMWDQFFAQPNCTTSSSTALTVLKFDSPDRVNMTNLERFQELERWRMRFHSPEAYGQLIDECLAAIVQSAYRELDDVCETYEKTRVWKLRTALRKSPVIKEAGEAIIRRVIP